MKKMTLTEKIVLISIIIVCCFILIIVLIHPEGPKFEQDQPAEIIDSENILTQVDKRVCEIVDVQGNIVECFYGSFDYVEDQTYGKVWYYEKDLTRIYYVLPGGTIKIYSLEDKE